MNEYKTVEVFRMMPFCTTLHSEFAAAMSLKSSIPFISVLWRYATAFPAGPGFWPNGTSSPTPDFRIAAAYSLIDTYDASNWLNKFDVQDVSGTSVCAGVTNIG
jgi:hypothetical protein